RSISNKHGSAGEKHQSNTKKNIVHAWNGHAVAQRLIPGRVRGVGNVSPTIRKTLEPFTFQRRQPADEPWLICTLQHQIRGILVLACALCAGYLSILENVDSLPAEHGMVIGGGQRIGEVCLVSDPVATVLRLPVNSIAGDAEYL